MTKEETHLLKVGERMDIKSFGLYIHTYKAAKIKFADLHPAKAETSKIAIRLARKLIAKKRQKGYMVATTAQMLKAGLIPPARQFEIRPKPGVKARWYVMLHVNDYSYQKRKCLLDAFVTWEKI